MLLRTEVLAEQHRRGENNSDDFDVLFCANTAENRKVYKDAVQLAGLASELSSFIDTLRISVADRINRKDYLEVPGYSGDQLLSYVNDMFDGYSFSNRMIHLKRELNYLRDTLRKENAICKEKYNTQDIEMMFYAEHSIYGVFMNKLLVLYNRLYSYGYDKNIMNVTLYLDYKLLFNIDEANAMRVIYNDKDKTPVAVSYILTEAIKNTDTIKEYRDFLEETILITEDKTSLVNYLNKTIQFLSVVASSPFGNQNEQERIRCESPLKRIVHMVYSLGNIYNEIEELSNSTFIREDDTNKETSSKNLIEQFNRSYFEPIVAAFYTELMTFLREKYDYEAINVTEKQIYNISRSVIGLAETEGMNFERSRKKQAKKRLAIDISPFVKKAFRQLRNHVSEKSFSEIRDALLLDAPIDPETVSENDRETLEAERRRLGLL